jgi:hypothetical protein
MGRETIYGADVMDAVLARLRAGETLRAICRDEGMPDHSTVLEWVRDDRNDFANRYARARESGAYAMADELLEIADGAADVQRDRLRADTRKWLLSKILPRVFGDKIDVTTQGEKVAGYVIPAPAEAKDADEWATQHKPR